ncbi:putative Protein kinase domain containing protein [Blattamonas nauphoetae]|uniref:mitogen-activated protein kinase kinase n=1 Tax=Blattamonas nauphoetae TaxID=2049346 RepID=A0ABQ9Y2J3_9EUKA|nr:putative Protein kinase domain containing protein [Blattamonas nauphoetae]
MIDTIPVPVGYSFVRIINSGGFGTVVEMIETSTSIHYAGKIVQCLTQKHKDRFDREVGRLKTFEHHRIIKLKEVATMGHTKVIVMELGGKSLAEIVRDLTERKVRMPREEVYRVMEDITSALDHVHNHPRGRTSHGDVKMENILMDADGHAKLCDFGAAESEDVTATSSAMTQLYVSPERMDSETGKATREADNLSKHSTEQLTNSLRPHSLTSTQPFGDSLIGLGFLQHPLSENATQSVCGAYPFGLGGEFCLWNGNLWKDGEDLRPEGTNKKCDRIEQTAAIRVNMRTREARLFVDDEEQPGIFTGIPSPLCLGISTKLQTAPIEVVHLAQIDILKTEQGRKALSTSARMKTLEEEKLRAEEKVERMRMMLRTEWNGTTSLKSLDRTAHRLTATTLKQIIRPEDVTDWRTAFTLPIDEGEWELKIRGKNIDELVMLGFLNNPLPEDAKQNMCGYYRNGIGGTFCLPNGAMLQGGEFKPAGTNKKWERAGQTAAIRVNMSTREARLFVGREEQPGIFTDIPSPLCLGISTHKQNTQIEVLWLKRI